MPQPDPIPVGPGALETAQQLGESLDNLAGQLKAVREASETASQANRKRISDLRKSTRRWRNLAIIIGVLAVAIAVMGYLVSRADSRAASATAQAAAADARSSVVTAAQKAMRTALIEGCETTNARNARQLVFWDYLFRTAKGPQTPETVKFEALVKQAFAPRNCPKAYALPPPASTAGRAR